MTRLKGQIQIYTGNGKGKTTAALGLAMRARGRGLKVAIIFFDKGGMNYGERSMLKKIDVDFWVTGLVRFNAKTKKFRFGVTKQDKLVAEQGLTIARKLLTDSSYDLIILDEINPTTHLKMLETNKVLAVIKDKAPNIELVLTGRNAPVQFRRLADLITNMILKKHYFYKGVEARKGIEF